MIMKTVIKRDGQIEPYNKKKIFDTILAAFDVSEDSKDIPRENLLNITQSIVSDVDQNVSGDDTPTENIYDIVKTILMALGYKDAANEFELYRKKRTRIRESNSTLMETYKELTFTSSLDSDIKRENGNINTDTAMGTMLKYGSEGAKLFNLTNVINPIHAKAHQEGIIHIHK